MWNPTMCDCECNKIIICLLLLVVICVVCYFYYTKYQTKQKSFFPFHDSNNKLKENNIHNIV